MSNDLRLCHGHFEGRFSPKSMLTEMLFPQLELRESEDSKSLFTKQTFFPASFVLLFGKKKVLIKYFLIRLWVAPRVVYFFRSRNPSFQLRSIKFIDRKPRNFDGIDMQVVSYG